MTDVAITEFEEIDPEELHLVGKGANGFKALLAKSATEEVREVLQTIADATETEIIKTDSDRPQCDSCKGTGKDDDAKCSKCRGTGLMPKVGETTKELADAAKASAASGAPVPVREDCPTCNGSGTLKTTGNECPDCDGSGKDSTQPPSDKLSRVDADGHHIHEGDAKGREKIDKAVDDGFCEDAECEVCKEAFGEDHDDLLEKAKLKYSQRKQLPDSAFALPGRHYPIHDENHARDALARVAQNGTPEEKSKVRAAVKRRYPNIDVGGDDATKADGTIISGANPALADAAATAGDDSSTDNDDASVPGSSAWEAIDAQTATDAAVALMAASELIRTFTQREAQEVAAGEGNDVFDVYSASEALCGISQAIGVMAQLAFHEGLAAAKSADDDGDVTKAGKRLAGRTVAALATARDHLTAVLGDDDPAKSGDKEDDDSDDADANKSQKDILDMTEDDLQKLVATTVAQAVVAAKSAQDELDEDAEKGLPAKNNAEAIASAKTANNKAKTKKPKAENKDLEDEADQGTDDSASSPATGAAKAEGDPEPEPDADEVPDDDEAAKAEDVELTPEEIEANETAEKARKEWKAAKKAQKLAAEQAVLTKSIEEALTKVVAQNSAIQEQNAALNATVEKLTSDLDGVKKMAAPSTAVRTRPADALNKSAERDALDLELSKYERLAKQADNLDYRRECSDRAKALRVRIAAMTTTV